MFTKSTIVGAVLSVSVFTLLAITLLGPSPSAAASVSATYYATEDTYVDASSPNTNFGATPWIYADAEPVQRSLVRFSVAEVSSGLTPLSARLKMFVVNPSPDGGQVQTVLSGDWSEAETTWSNAPAAGAVVADLPAAELGRWVEVDVTSAVTGGGVVDFYITTPNGDRAGYRSLEGGIEAPTLVVEWPQQSTSMTFGASDDASIWERQPDANRDSAPLEADGNPRSDFLLKFSVAGVGDRSVSSAKIRLVNVNRSGTGGDIYATQNADWSESSVTWNTAPSAQGPALDSLGAVSVGGVAEFDVAAVIQGDGEYSFRVLGHSNDGADYSPREGADPPQLILELSGGSGGPPPTSTATPPPTMTVTPTPPPPTTTATPPPPPPTATATPPPPPPTATATPPSTPTPPPSGTVLNIAAVGDIHPPASSANSAATAAEAAKADLILGLGDYQYQSGTMAEYNAYFDKDWGPNIHKMYPVLAPTHDQNWQDADPLRYWNGGGASGYKAPVTLSPHQSYSFDSNGWHFIAIDDACYRDTANCSPAALLAWVTADLATHPAQCTIAYWHQPYFTSTTSGHAAFTDIKPVVVALGVAGVDVVLSGHNHDYERFAPQNAEQVADPNGMRAFVVGTGGIGFYQFRDTAPNSVTRTDSTYGVLRMSLRAGSYDWEFVATGGSAYSDSGSGSCH